MNFKTSNRFLIKGKERNKQYMTKANTTHNYKKYHTQFGGYVYTSDFNTDYRGKDNIYGSTIASRIAQDQKFDEQCRKNIENRKNYGGK